MTTIEEMLKKTVTITYTHTFNGEKWVISENVFADPYKPAIHRHVIGECDSQEHAAHICKVASVSRPNPPVRPETPPIVQRPETITKEQIMLVVGNTALQLAEKLPRDIGAAIIVSGERPRPFTCLMGNRDPNTVRRWFDEGAPGLMSPFERAVGRTRRH